MYYEKIIYIPIPASCFRTNAGAPCTVPSTRILSVLSLASQPFKSEKMSWLRSAVSKAVEVGNKNNLTRTIRNYTNSVVQHAGQAGAEGAKRFQDQMGGRSFRSVKKSIQRWEEAAVSCRRPERLRDIEKVSAAA
ncbi:rootletin-like [Pyrus ussuriensis x Pyrus communis]|uniref:Rootletin-like n=1 Tax=Pyrus ussuriensis x Pyrus communis TaxID=2448454 RepID=A0A5N5H8I0_9ROSA|nr:rootletin-like [Pyrus ussuriensis x Pyrus communis]